MNISQYREIVACLAGDRVLYHYYPDRYAFMLLSWAAGSGVRLDTLEQSRFGTLLAKPSVRNALNASGYALRGDTVVDADAFAAHWPSETRSFVLGLANWHGFQTSREGKAGHNLVLQLNFTREHMDELHSRFGSTDIFNSSAHPVQSAAGTRRRETLAWARIDLDFASNEALIEEVQSDWVAGLHWAVKHGWWMGDQRLGARQWQRYADESMGWLRGAWGEAMLAAAVAFIRHELGIERIFYHTWEGGMLTKRMSRCPPPRSVYTRLPKQFCAKRSSEVPEFLLQDRRLRRLFRARKDIRFFQLKA